jgi:hypothetical protein
MKLHTRKTPNLIGWGSKEEIGKDFKITIPSSYKILYANYYYGNWEGSAYVLGYCTKRKEYFEVHGSHCSCYGLEGQWGEEWWSDKDVLLQAIEKRVAANRNWRSDHNVDGGDEFVKWLLE